jgi:hypothetical protein
MCPGEYWSLAFLHKLNTHKTQHSIDTIQQDITLEAILAGNDIHDSVDMYHSLFLVLMAVEPNFQAIEITTRLVCTTLYQTLLGLAGLYKWVDLSRSLCLLHGRGNRCVQKTAPMHCESSLRTPLRALRTIQWCQTSAAARI